MDNKPKISKKVIIWDVIGPFVMLILYMIIASFAVLIIGALVTGINDYELLFSLVPSLSLWVNIIFYAAAIIFLGKAYKNDDFRFGERKLIWPIWKAAAAIVIGTALSYLLNILFYAARLHEIFPKYDESAVLSFSGQNIILLVAATVIIGPIAEEIVFRGLVFSRMRAYLGLVPCMIISSLLFGLYHMNVVQFIYTALLGLYLSFIYEKSGSLLVSILTHAAMNLFALTSYF